MSESSKFVVGTRRPELSTDGGAEVADLVFPKGIAYIGSLQKRIFDILVALAAITLLSPIMLIIFVSLKLTQKNAFFSHRRVGVNGSTFRVLKFQTMVDGAEERLKDVLARDPEARREWELNEKLVNDPRVTRFGRFLRKTSLDELPQLFNVLLGDMSVVGPRPMIADERARWGADIALYDSMKPGITGEWQLFSRTGSSYDTRTESLRRYARNASVFRDTLYVLRTGFVFFETSKAA